MSKVQVSEVRGARDRRDFIRLPWTIYARDPHWVPPLLVEEKEFFDPRRNPFARHAEVRLLLARRGRRPVGRITAQIDPVFDEFHGGRFGFFGFYECLEDEEAPAALFRTAGDWLRGRGARTILGPMNYSTNYTCGFLLDGFDSSPYVLMPHTPPRYNDDVRRAGYHLAKTLYAYHRYSSVPLPERFDRVVAKIQERERIEMRSLSRRRLADDVRIIEEIYNSAWERNWGFVPMTCAEFEWMVNKLTAIADDQMAILGFIRGEPAGFILSIPDFNRVLKRLGGRLLPFGILRILWAVQCARRNGRLFSRHRIHALRTILLGVRPEFRKSGVDAVLFRETFRRSVVRGYAEGEMSWVLEDNGPMNNLMKKFGAEVHKRYGIYELDLEEPARS